MNRTESAELTKSYNGKMVFPYDASDLANYLCFLCHDYDLKKGKRQDCDPSPDTDTETTQVNENAMDNSGDGKGFFREDYVDQYPQNEINFNHIDDDEDFIFLPSI